MAHILATRHGPLLENWEVVQIFEALMCHHTSVKGLRHRLSYTHCIEDKELFKMLNLCKTATLNKTIIWFKTNYRFM